MEKTAHRSDPKRTASRPPYPEQSQDSPGHSSKMQPEPDHGETSYRGLGRLEKKVAIVTGGDSGIGRAVALAYAREGADVVVGYLNEHEDAAQTKRWVEEAGRQCLTVAGDLAEEAGCHALIDAAVERFDKVDILVNNAAYQGKAVDTLEDLSYARIDHTFRTNIVAMFALVQRLLPHLQAGGSVINVASIQAYKPSPGILDYASTKGAIVAFTKGLAQELIKTHGVRVNCVAPGPVWTPLIVQSFPTEKVKKFGAQSPMERPAQPAELAPSFVFLASDEGRFVNGEILGVTGGGLLA